jgi:hypothetical protein
VARKRSKPASGTTRAFLSAEEEDQIRLRIIEQILRIRCRTRQCRRAWCRRSGRCYSIARMDATLGSNISETRAP